MVKRIFPRIGFVLYCTMSVLAVVVPFGPADAADPTPAKAPVDTCLDSGFRVDRTNAELRVLACSTALQSHKLTEPEVALARINRGAARTALGDHIQASGDYQEALKHYDGAIDAKGPDAMALYQRAAALDGLGQTDRALADYDEAIRLEPKFSLAFYARAIVHAARKRAYDRAILDFSRALELEPRNVDALVKRGDAYGQMGDFGHALADLDRAVVLAPNNAEAYIFRGLVNSRRSEKKLAMSDYNAALKIDPRNIDGLVNRAAIYATDGQEDLAIADLDAAIAMRKDDPFAFYNRGYAHFAKRHYDLAIADYSAAIELDPTMGLAFNNRCLTRALAGNELTAALADCDVALKLMPRNADVRDTRGFIYLKLGEPAIALVEYNAGLEVDSSHALAHYGRGIAQIKLGHRKEGEADQAAARALDPHIERQFSMYGVH